MTKQQRRAVRRGLRQYGDALWSGDKAGAGMEWAGVVAKVMDYYAENRRGVERITRFDILDLQHRLPRWMLQIPYDILNRMNRRKLLRENTGLTTSIRMDDYRIEPVGDGCFDLFYIAVK